MPDANAMTVDECRDWLRIVDKWVRVVPPAFRTVYWERIVDDDGKMEQCLDPFPPTLDGAARVMKDGRLLEIIEWPNGVITVSLIVWGDSEKGTGPNKIKAEVHADEEPDRLKRLILAWYRANVAASLARGSQ